MPVTAPDETTADLRSALGDEVYALLQVARQLTSIAATDQDLVRRLILQFMLHVSRDLLSDLASPESTVQDRVQAVNQLLSILPNMSSQGISVRLNPETHTPECRHPEQIEWAEI